MHGICFMAVLALICTNALFAGEPSGKAAAMLDKEGPAKHVIQPPDVIQIEMLKLIPKPPYRLEVFDVLQIRGKALPDQPVDDYYMVEADGTINLGPTYGSVRVVGMTTDEIRSTLNKSLHQWHKDPTVSVQLARVSGAQPVTGQYLVNPDGIINLRRYGVVKIAGKTATEARVAIQDHLKQYLDSPEIFISVLDHRKIYYVITQEAGQSESVSLMSLTGKVTVLDALTERSQLPIEELSKISVKKIWIDRPARKKVGGQQILPIDWEAIVKNVESPTNYSIVPGDRLFIVYNPVQGQMAFGVQTMGRNYNRNRSGF